MSGLTGEIESIQTLFKSKIKDIADKITKDANTISGIVDRMRGIVTNSGNASHKISELRALIEQVDSDEHLSKARQIYASELKNLNSALDGKAPELDQETPASNSMFSGIFSGTKSTGFMNNLKTFATQKLEERGIKLSKDDFKTLITDKSSIALTRNYTNLNDIT